MSEELRSKLKRLDILLKNKSKLDNRLNKLENVKNQYEEITAENSGLE